MLLHACTPRATGCGELGCRPRFGFGLRSRFSGRPGLGIALLPGALRLHDAAREREAERLRLLNSEVARIAETLARKGWQRGDGHRGEYRFLATGDTEAFREEGTRFLQLPIGDVEHVPVADCL